MNTRFLETLVWLTRLRSFSRAAEKLNTTQPAISNRINKLEELLGAKLYDRSSRQFELTPAGRRILRHAEQIVSLSSELQELVTSDETLDVQLRIGVIELATMSWLPRFVDRFAEVFPKVALTVGTGTSRQLIDKLRDDEVDLIFVVGPVNEPNMLSRPICNLGLGWVANPRRYDCETEIDIVELSRMPIVLQPAGSSGYDQIIEYFRAFGIINVPPHDRKLMIDCIYSVGTSVDAVRSGLGIMSLPLFLFCEDFASGRVGQIRVRQALQPYHITACCKQPVTNQLIQRVADMAAESAAAHAATCDPTHVWI